MSQITIARSQKMTNSHKQIRKKPQYLKKWWEHFIAPNWYGKGVEGPLRDHLILYNISSHIKLKHGQYMEHTRLWFFDELNKWLRISKSDKKGLEECAVLTCWIWRYRKM